MYRQEMLLQVVDFQKNLFDTSFDMIAGFQDRRNEMIRSACERNVLLPESGKKLYNAWRHYFEQNRQDCKFYMDKNFDLLKAFFEDQTTTPSQGSPKKESA